MWADSKLKPESLTGGPRRRIWGGMWMLQLCFDVTLLSGKSFLKRFVCVFMRCDKDTVVLCDITGAKNMLITLMISIKNF